MVSDVLFLSYLDKIRLIPTGEAGQALAYLYSEARLYKGARMVPLSLLTTTRSTGNISGGWVAKSVARQLATAELWVRIQTSLKNDKWAT